MRLTERKRGAYVKVGRVWHFVTTSILLGSRLGIENTGQFSLPASNEIHFCNSIHIGAEALERFLSNTLASVSVVDLQTNRCSSVFPHLS